MNLFGLSSFRPFDLISLLLIGSGVLLLLLVQVPIKQ